MNALLNKFANVTIKNENRISELDQKYCEKQEKTYREALHVMEKTLESFKLIYNNYSDADKNNYSTYIDKFDDIRHLEDRIEKIKGGFISRIIYHFEKTYNVTLKDPELKKKYDVTVTYQDIVNEVFEQLGGFNFNEKAVQEIKDKISNEVRNDNIEIKKNKLTIPYFVYVDHFDKKWGRIRMSYSCRDKVGRLFKALTHFEIGETETVWYYQNIQQSLNEDNPFIKYELGYEKVQSIKFFQNGKVEITFQNMQQAEEFKNEYLTK
jgi:hypothetical protein